MIEWHGPAASDHFTPGRDVAIDRIVIHTMVSSIDGADAIFKGGSRMVSAHYGIAQTGAIWQWVKEEDTAWHAGDWPMNQRSIGIEHEDKGDYNGTRPDALYTSSAWLVHDICTRYSIPIDRQHILKHSEVSATQCPDALDIDRIVREAAALADARFNVLGTSSVTADGLKTYCPTAPSGVPELYISLSAQVGIRPEIAFAQAVKETNKFQFGGTALADWHNPAGLGVTGAAGVGNQFPDWETGIRAHLGHLLWYFGATHPIVGFCDKDQRHFGAHKGYANDIRKLDGHWAVPGDQYGESIANIADAILTTSPAQVDPFWSHTDSETVTWGQLHAYNDKLIKFFGKA